MKPITFSTPMVQAILEGRKSMTRRVIKIEDAPENWKISVAGTFIVRTEPWDVKLPRYATGDILWVRETWYKNYPHKYGRYWYRADGEEIDMPTIYGGTVIYGKADGLKWRPSIFMPREAARIFLRVTNVRVERLQDITEGDAIAEGMSKTLVDGVVFISAKGNFHVFWDSLNIKRGYGWDTNPWVWVYEFERISKEEAERLETLARRNSMRLIDAVPVVRSETEKAKQEIEEAFEEACIDDVEKAISYLRDVEKAISYLRVAIGALERQVPKETIGEEGYHDCTVCGAGAIGPYCYKCGQRLDWESEGMK